MQTSCYQDQIKLQTFLINKSDYVAKVGTVLNDKSKCANMTKEND